MMLSGYELLVVVVVWLVVVLGPLLAKLAIVVARRGFSGRVREGLDEGSSRGR
jgi:hypothetical protein